MQKGGKHQGGQGQGYSQGNYPHRSYSVGQDSSRSFPRNEVQSFHASSSQGAGPGMRSIHHAPPNQPPTPPTQDLKQAPGGHMQPPSHQLQAQLHYALPRNSGTTTNQFYAARGPQAQRVHPTRPPVVMSNNAQPYIAQQVQMTQMYTANSMVQAPMASAHQQQMFMPSTMGQVPSFPMHPRQQGGSYYPQPPQILMPPFLQYGSPTVFYTTTGIPGMARSGPGGVPNSQGGAAPPPPPQAGIPGMQGPGSMVTQQPGPTQQQKPTRRKAALAIIDPESGRDVMTDILHDSTPPRSGESSARQTPQPQSISQAADQTVAAEFATRVAKAARGDESDSPLQHSPALQQGSYSEPESQPSPDHGTTPPGLSPSKLDSAVETLPGEVEKNIGYDPMIRGGWLPHVDHMHIPVQMHHPIMVSDEMMRATMQQQQQQQPPPPRDYQVPGTWLPDGTAMPVSVIINKEPSDVGPGNRVPERVTPVVSALAHAPTVDVTPRHQREPFPALGGKGQQHQSPARRKPRPETDSVPKQQLQQQQPPPPEQQQQPTKKPQDHVDFAPPPRVLEHKTMLIKRNEEPMEERDPAAPPAEQLTAFHENNNNTRACNQSELKCELAIVAPAEVPTEVYPVTDTVPMPKVVTPPPPVHTVSTPPDEAASKTNGETLVVDDAKANNQKAKGGGSKRQTQPQQQKAASNMRQERRQPSNTEVEPLAVETVAPLPVLNNNEQQDNAKELPNEEEEKEEQEALLVAVKNEENNKQTASLKQATPPPAIEQQPVIETKRLLKHNYKEDQWSPINPEGKKIYEREFMLELQNDPLSKKKPDYFPELELLKDTLGKSNRNPDRNFINTMGRNHGDSLMPKFANSSSSQRGGSGPQITKRGSQQGKPKPSGPPKIQVSLSLHQDVKLNETENAWKPNRATEQEVMTEEEAKTEDLYKRVRGVLNKLTPQKFNKLVQQVQSLPIDNSVRLQGVIDLVFKKAVDEPNFSVAYAQMCNILQKMQVPADSTTPDGPPAEANFRKLLITRCQQEFEKNTAAELNRDERLKDINTEPDLEKRKQMTVTFEEEERRIRMKSVGNIRFIGELFKLQMLTTNIMHRCVAHLLKEGEEESLECLCKLLTTVGRGLEGADRGEQNLNDIFKRLAEIAKNKGSGKVSSRVRFMIQDLIDLRSNKWIPRRDDSNPKTLDQIQKEADREQMEMNIALNSPQERNKRQDSRNQMDNRKRPDNGGWQVAGQAKPNKVVFESSKFKLAQSVVDVSSNVSLGSRNQFAWSMGAGTNKPDDKKTPQLSTNMFAALESDMGPPHSVAAPTSRSSSLKGDSSFRPGLQDDVRHSPNSRSSSRDSMSSGPRSSRPTPPPPAVSAPQQSKVAAPAAASPSPSPAILQAPQPKQTTDPEKLQQETRAILEDYVTSMDGDMSCSHIVDKFNTATIHQFVVDTFMLAFEMKGFNTRRKVGSLLYHALRKVGIPRKQFLDGLGVVFEASGDLAIDVPRVWEYLAEMLCDSLCKDAVTFKDLAAAMKPLKGEPGATKLLTEVLALVGSELGGEKLKEKWADANVAFTDFLAADAVDKFVAENQLEKLTEARSSQAATLSWEAIGSSLTKMMLARQNPDSVASWIEEAVGARAQTPRFLRTLMTAMLDAVIQKGKLQTDLLRMYDQLIKKYSDHKEELELPCLFATQAVVNQLEHPQGLLLDVFNHLWDNDLIATESFKCWRDSKDELEGHGVATKCLTSFFTSITEGDSEEES